MKYVIIKAIILHGLAFGDAYTTNRGINRWYGIGERNPIYRPVAGTPAMYVTCQIPVLITELAGRNHWVQRHPYVQLGAQVYVGQGNLRGIYNNLSVYHRMEIRDSGSAWWDKQSPQYKQLHGGVK